MLAKMVPDPDAIFLDKVLRHQDRLDCSAHTPKFLPWPLKKVSDVSIEILLCDKDVRNKDVNHSSR